MTLGFWVHLCTKSYKPKFWDKKGFFEAVFPNYVPEKGLRKIAPIQNDLLAILRLRNRISHHEMIINSNKTPQEQYQLVLNMLHLLSTDMENLLNNISRFEDTKLYFINLNCINFPKYYKISVYIYVTLK